jgi:hypothetical protein
VRRFFCFSVIDRSVCCVLSGVKRARALVHSKSIGNVLRVRLFLDPEQSCALFNKRDGQAHHATLTAARVEDLTHSAVRSKLKLDSSGSVPPSPNPAYSTGGFPSAPASPTPAPERTSNVHPTAPVPTGLPVALEKETVVTESPRTPTSPPAAPKRLPPPPPPLNTSPTASPPSNGNGLPLSSPSSPPTAEKALPVKSPPRTVSVDSMSNESGGHGSVGGAASPTSPNSVLSASHISPPPRNHQSEALAYSKFEAEEEARERREAAEKLQREEARRAEEEVRRVAKEAERKKREKEEAERQRRKKAEEEKRAREEMELRTKAEQKREAKESLRKKFEDEGPGDVLLTGSVTVQGGDSLVSQIEGPYQVSIAI